MNISNDELQFILGAVDGVRCQSTQDARVKGQLLGKFAVELELRGQKKDDVENTDEVPEE